MLNQKTFRFLAIIWTVLILYLSLTTIKTHFGNNIKIANIDKIVHFTFYFIFVVLWMFAINFKEYKPNNTLKIVLISIGLGIGIEMAQSHLTKTRSSDVVDVLANYLGAISGLIAFKYYLQKRKSKEISH